MLIVIAGEDAGIVIFEFGDDRSGLFDGNRLNDHTAANPLDQLTPVTDVREVLGLISTVTRVHVSDAVQRYAVALATATRTSTELRLGASPRATLQLVRAAKAAAAMSGREYVIPDDLHRLAHHVLSHRLLPSLEASRTGRNPSAVLTTILQQVPVPDGARA